MGLEIVIQNQIYYLRVKFKIVYLQVSSEEIYYQTKVCLDDDILPH